MAARVPADRPTFVVAIGAAGGKEGLERLLRELPAEAGELLRAGAGRITFVEVTLLGEIGARLEAREKMLSTVARAGWHTLGRAPLQPTLKLLAQEIREALGTDLCGLWARHPDTGHFSLECGVGWREEPGTGACVTVAPDSLLTRALAMEEPVVVTDLTADPRFSFPAVLAEEGAKSGIAYAVGRGEAGLGVLTAFSRAPRHFDRPETDLFASIANLAWGVLERARLERRLALEDGTIRALARARDSMDATRRLLDVVSKLDVQLAELWMPSESGDVLKCVRTVSTSAFDDTRWREFSEPELRRGEGLAGRAWASGRAELVGDLEGGLLAVRSQLAGALGLRAGFGVPIIAGGEVAGVVTAFSTGRQFADPDLLGTLETAGHAVGEFIRRTRAEEARRKTEARLKESERSFRMLAESIPHMVWTARPDGSIDYCNRRTLELTGRALAEVSEPEAWIESLHPDDRDRARAHWRETLRRGEEAHLDVRIRRASDGAYLWHSVHPVPMKDAEGRVRRWFGTSTNIHDRKEAEAFLRQAARQKDEFLAVLSHELRNPLSAIRTATELLALTHGADPDLRTTQAVLARQTAHMTRLIDGLLDVSRIVHGKLTIDRKPLDVVETLRDVLRDRAAYVKAHRLSMRTDLPGQPLWVNGDRVRLAQVFDNLISNAANFTSPPGLITVTAGRTGDEAVISVRDTGIGLTEDMRTKIFEPFQQAPQGMARTTGGLGLGLALSKGILDLHGGSIEAKSEGPGKGAELIVRLPLVAAPRRRRPAGAREVAPPEGLRILVVEDNEDAALLLEKLLSMEGHSVSVVATGVEALSRMRSDHPDVVLCDLGLPGMSGYDVARVAKADSELRDIRLVAVTGYGRAEDRQRSDEAGFSAHLVKPVDRESLRSVIARVAA